MYACDSADRCQQQFYPRDLKATSDQLVRDLSKVFKVGHLRGQARRNRRELDIHAVHFGVILASIELATFRCRACHTPSTTAEDAVIR
jgi:hypothetical protein